MALEDLTGTKYIDSLVSSNPTSSDDIDEGDDHIRGLKNVIVNTAPNITGAITATQAELNLIDGSVAGTIVNSKAVIYGSAGEVNATTLQVAGSSITATPTEINVLDISANAISGYTQGSVHYIRDTKPSAAFDIATNVTSTGETVGPTGSGATNIWAAMNDLPSGAVAVMIRIWGKITATASGYNFISVHAAEDNTAGLDQDRILYFGGTADVSGEIFIGCTEITIPVDANKTFWIEYETDASPPTVTTLAMAVVGFIA